MANVVIRAVTMTEFSRTPQLRQTHRPVHASGVGVLSASTAGRWNDCAPRAVIEAGGEDARGRGRVRTAPEAPGNATSGGEAADTDGVAASDVAAGERVYGRASPGDATALRGLPMIGVAGGYGGAIRGTQPGSGRLFR